MKWFYFCYLKTDGCIFKTSPKHYIWMQTANNWVISNMTFFLLLLTYFYCKYWICVIVIDLWSGTDGDCISLAVTQSHIWALDRQTFQTIMMRSTQARHEEYFSFLRRYIHATNICAYLSVVNFTHTITHNTNKHTPPCLAASTHIQRWLWCCGFKCLL